MSRILACFALASLTILPAAESSPQIAGAGVSGSSVSIAVPLSLPGGLAADLTLSFEQVAGLSLESLGLSAHVIDPNDLALLVRLPGGSIPTGFPVLLRIEPPATGGLSFNGIVRLEIHTGNLHYVSGSPLRLFAAPLGGPFHDITVDMGAGSYRARGTEGGFSEFLLVADPRPVDQVITGKLDRLEEILDANAGTMPGPLYADLAARLASIRARHAAGATGDAIEEVDDFLDLVEQRSGGTIPDLWRATRDRVNVAGLLRAGAMTLRFSLRLKANLVP